MRQPIRFRALAVACLGVVLGGIAVAQQPPSPPAPRAAAATVDQRVSALLARMTPAEKVGQLVQAGAFPGMDPAGAIRRGAGSVLWLNDPKQFNALQKVAVEETRLKIPVLFALDVIHGYQTIFPVPLAMAASWDPSEYEQAQAVAAREARAAGLHWTFGPMLDIARDARWGRMVEGAGEDPYLGAAMAVAQVRGFQGPSLGTPGRLIATAKHFAGYGAADGGRDYDPVYLPENLLRNVYLPPFQAAAKAGVGSFMSAYMDLNEVPATANRFLLHDVLRGEWGFQGFVVSDAFGVANLITQGAAKDGPEAARRAVNAGLDVDMASNTYGQHLAAEVQAGRVSMATLDAAVRPILAAKIRLGLFEHPYVDEAAMAGVLADPAHRARARRAAQRTLVLLRNEQQALPLRKDVASIAVIGPVADSKADTEGSWMVFGHQPAAVTVLEGIKAKVGAATTVIYASGPEIRRDIPSMFDQFTGAPRKPPQTREESDAAFAEAVAAAKGADVAIMVLGESANMSGEAASRASLDLPGRQEELLEAVTALGKPVVLVLINGRPLTIPWAAEHVPAILEAWQPGTEGGHAIADALFGDVNPGGKLPVTFPRKAAHAPLYYARVMTHQPEGTPRYSPRYWDGAEAPLFPFGYGLSYTTFAYGTVKVSAPSMAVGAKTTVSVEVTNTGRVAGDEVAQLYIRQRTGTDTRPRRELKGFSRVTLAPGESRTLTFTLGPEELRYWSTVARKVIQEPALFDVWVGGDSNASAHGEFEVTAAATGRGAARPEAK